ncbi:MAG: helix-turn-helix transcriptional regulator [Clostridia bacterium]|nr:helix-turn-helix transcriptional regulator [Clostridia bacterium]
MGNTAKFIGHRIREYRVQRGITQEKLAELAGCHPTYIGQIERGEKNVSLGNIAKISSAMRIPLSKLVEGLEEEEERDIPQECYDLLAGKSKAEQEKLYRILLEITGGLEAEDEG